MELNYKWARMAVFLSRVEEALEGKFLHLHVLTICAIELSISSQSGELSKVAVRIFSSFIFTPRKNSSHKTRATSKIIIVNIFSLLLLFIFQSTVSPLKT